MTTDLYELAHIELERARKEWLDHIATLERKLRLQEENLKVIAANLNLRIGRIEQEKK